MKLVLTITLVLVTLSCAFAGDVDDRIAALRMDSGWTEIGLTTETKRANWSVRIFRHEEGSELLTFVCYSKLGPRSMDDAWDFAPSGYLHRFPQNRP